MFYMFKIILPDKTELCCQDEQSALSLSRQKAKEFGKTILIKQIFEDMEEDYGMVYPSGELGRAAQFGLFKSTSTKPSDSAKQKPGYMRPKPEIDFGFFKQLSMYHEKKKKD